MSDTKLRQGYLTSTLARFMSEDELQELNDKYSANLFITRRATYEPSEQDISVYKKWIDGKLVLSAQLAEAMGCTYGTVVNRFMRIGRSVVTGEIKL